MKMTPPRVIIGTLIAAILFLFSLGVYAQTVQLIPVPRQVILSNTGTIQPNMVLYVFLAGTSTAASVYTDFTGTVLLSNPVAADSSGRLPQIWALNQLIKLVACVQNDGATCASGDTLWTADGINAFGGGSTGSASSPFISASPNPATTGILRLASGDTTCFRNAANNGNLCWSKDASDRLSWSAGTLMFPEVVNSGADPAGFDLLWADSTHRWSFSNNGGAGDYVIGRNTIDSFTNKTFDTGAAGMVFKIAGTQLTGVTGSGNTVALATSPALTTPTIGGSVITNVPQMVFTVNLRNTDIAANTAVGVFIVNSPIQIKDFSMTDSTGGLNCTTYPVVAIYDETAASALSSITQTLNMGVISNTGLSVNVPAGHTLDVRQTTHGACSAGGAGTASAVYIMQ